MITRCKYKHRKTWIMGGAWLWCPDCGAIRPNISGRVLWVYPEGTEKANRRLRKQIEMVAKNANR